MRRNIKKIDKVKIGKKTYGVKIVNTIKESIIETVSNTFKGVKTVGQIDFDKNIIQIRKDKKDKLQTFYHEMAHGLCFELSRRYKEFNNWNSNEKFIDYLGNKLSKIKVFWRKDE